MNTLNTKQNMKKIGLIIENARQGELWGRINYDDNLLIDKAETLEQLQENMKKLLADFHDLDPATVVFDLSYDLSSFFEMYNYLKISEIAKVAGLNSGLLRHYVAGSKTASKAQMHKIQEALWVVGKQLMAAKLEF
jgi:hypothetical protein